MGLGLLLELLLLEGLYHQPKGGWGAEEGSDLCFTAVLLKQFLEAGSVGEAEWDCGHLEYPQGVRWGESTQIGAGLPVQPSWVQPALPGSCPGLSGVRTLLCGGRTGSVIRQPSWLRGGPPVLLNLGHGLLLQEEGMQAGCPLLWPASPFP